MVGVAPFEAPHAPAVDARAAHAVIRDCLPPEAAPPARRWLQEDLGAKCSALQADAIKVREDVKSRRDARAQMGWSRGVGQQAKPIARTTQH